RLSEDSSFDTARDIRSLSSSLSPLLSELSTSTNSHIITNSTYIDPQLLKHDRQAENASNQSPELYKKIRRNNIVVVKRIKRKHDKTRSVKYLILIISSVSLFLARIVR